MFSATKGSCRKLHRKTIPFAHCLHKKSDQQGHVELGSPRTSPEVINSTGDELHPKTKTKTKVGSGQNALEIKKCKNLSELMI